jgi:hypothetical protein
MAVAGRRIVVLALLLGGCGSDGSDGSPGTPAPTPTKLAKGEPPPGVIVAITALSGATGGGGTFQSGDNIEVRFTLKKRDGAPWKLSEMALARILVSGPTFNYQRVIAEQSDVALRAEKNGDGSFSYLFAQPIPAVYLPPLNDSPSFGAVDGELSGQPLLKGTYTVGISFAWAYTVEGEPFHDAGEATADFRLGAGAVFAPRRVVGQANCELCHVSLQAHGGLRRDLTLCLMCHTAGAEDLNDPNVLGGSPGVTVNSRVLFHKIHNGKHLPSVLGVGTNPDGSRNYALPKIPYRLVSADGSVRDYSDVGFPVFPNREQPLPKDFDHKMLAAPEQALEDEIRRGVAQCSVCHGDPDGAGPLQAPAQGTLIESQPSRPACGACHDDVDWDLDYAANQSSMPPQPNSSGCNVCHEPSGGPLSIVDGHRHPLLDPSYNLGLAFDLQGVSEAGASNGNGRLDPGEQVAVSFSILDGMGTNVLPSALLEIRAALSGPTGNANLLLDARITPALLTGAQPFTASLPELLQLELVGKSTAALGDVFATLRAPHFDVAGAQTQVQVRTATGATSTLVDAAFAPQNFVDLANASGFARDDLVVIDDGLAGSEEYLKVQLVDGNRLWFSSPATPAYPPGLRFDHAIGASVKRVTLTPKTKNVDFLLDAANGVITELTEFGAGNAVLVTYTTPYVVPATYPPPLNDSPDLDETWGEWTAKPLVDGTYQVGVWGSQDVLVQLEGEMNHYTAASAPAALDVLVGPTAKSQPYGLISSGANCNACHQDLAFHGGANRGFDTCILCHGTAGSEDRPRYVAANAPATDGVTVNLRTLLHAIHMGKLLANPQAFTVVGAGAATWPDNFTAKSYATFEFPAMPGAAAQCAKCHGPGNTAWLEPAPRDHPTAQGAPVRVWGRVCAACHDSTATAAHIAAQTPAGVEACEVCHGDGKAFAVDIEHFAR